MYIITNAMVCPTSIILSSSQGRRTSIMAVSTVYIITADTVIVYVITYILYSISIT